MVRRQPSAGLEGSTGSILCTLLDFVFATSFVVDFDAGVRLVLESILRNRRCGTSTSLTLFFVFYGKFLVVRFIPQ